MSNGEKGVHKIRRYALNIARAYDSFIKKHQIGDELSLLCSKLEAAERGVALIESRLDRIEGVITRLAAPEATPANIETALISAGLAARARRLGSALERLPSHYRPAQANDYDACLLNLRALNPRLFPVWLQLFENGKRSYYEQKEASCSHRTHYYAKLFASYLEIYARGRILDIGCGPHGIPSYLASHDKTMISGIEPLPLSVAPDFECVRGFNEFLPWPDQSFHTVLSGTSLDHVLSLDVSLAEVRRVLTLDGRYVVWLASIPGSTEFDPSAIDFRPIDDFHLFHFDRAWIEPQFERFFDIEDVTMISQPGFDHVFYSMRPK